MEPSSLHLPTDPPDAVRPPSTSAERRDPTELATVARRQVEALDQATVAISQELSLERILQIIVDSVRPLASARYAALGIPDEVGSMERFVTSGLSDEERAAIGHPPRGRGLLGISLHEALTFRVDDIAADPRSVGFPPHHPHMTTLLSVPVKVEGRAIGNLYLCDRLDGRPFDGEDERLVESFARHAGLAIHNARLHQELRELAVLQERERIAQDLHDGSIQSLYAASLILEDTLELMAIDPAAAVARVDDAIETIQGTIAEIRDFIVGLDAEDRSSVDLMPGLEALAEDFARATFIEVTVTGELFRPVDADDSLQLVQLAREALSNVARHSEATTVAVAVADSPEALSLSIIDDGHGFDPGQEQRPGHHGLTNMRARAESLGGSLTIDSDERGTRVVFRMPRDTAETFKESRT